MIALRPPHRTNTLGPLSYAGRSYVEVRCAYCPAVVWRRSDHVKRRGQLYCSRQCASMARTP